MQAQRTMVTDSQLDTMVFLAVDEMVEKQVSFTAHDVTTALRVENTTLEIEHPRVKAVLKTILSDGEMPGYELKPDDSLPGSPLRYQKGS